MARIDSERFVTVGFWYVAVVLPAYGTYKWYSLGRFDKQIARLLNSTQPLNPMMFGKNVILKSHFVIVATVKSAVKKLLGCQEMRHRKTQ